ncbi:nuclear transport factor 2 family protein [Kribbia dieselivorans]|uniref:nuclear transport factor 2 family protein n=1 Tax=Kribbia dieselivorans TaxID=331526 RepID=UPI000838650A|nr:nuclear transport factor 2 family protein [Kribbia dieselivorans]
MNYAEIHATLSTHFATYFEAVDVKDLDTVLDVLDGAVVTIGGAEITDPAQVRAFYEGRLIAPDGNGRRLTKHHVTNILWDGPDEAGVYDVRAYYFRLEPGKNRPRVTTSGRLQQRVVRDGWRWRVVHHAIVTDF